MLGDHVPCPITLGPDTVSQNPAGFRQVGISMMQIIASGSGVYDIPWPPVFASFLETMKVRPKPLPPPPPPSLACSPSPVALN